MFILGYLNAFLSMSFMQLSQAILPHTVNFYYCVLHLPMPLFHMLDYEFQSRDHILFIFVFSEPTTVPSAQLMHSKFDKRMSQRNSSVHKITYVKKCT